MRIFEELEMEFFNPLDQMPKDREKVMIVLNKGQYHDYELRYCRVHEYSSVPTRFLDLTENTRYTIGQVRCWGRLKKN